MSIRQIVQRIANNYDEYLLTQEQSKYFDVVINLKKAVATVDSLGNANFAPSNDQMYATQMLVAKFAFPRANKRD